MGQRQLVVTLLGGLIGAVSMSGSVIAWAKLDGLSRNRCASRPADL
jgi:NAD(P) transhydrogenase subunit beta